jgi:hypothetical protein
MCDSIGAGAAGLNHCHSIINPIIGKNATIAFRHVLASK